MKKIREVITTKEYKRLNAFVIADDKLRAATKENLLKTFTLLYFSGCRVSELLQFSNQHILDIINNSETIIQIDKQHQERKLFFTDDGVKAIKKLFNEFNITDEKIESKVIRSKGIKHISPDKSTYTKLVNTVIHNCLGDRYSSHSFRAGLITQLAEAQINTALIRDFIGHANSSTTLRYVKSSESSIRNALVR